MTGIFGIVSKEDCSEQLFYGTDYHSHLGTQYGGLAVMGKGPIPVKRIHDISKSQFKSRFHGVINELKGKYGIGVISSKYAQPLTFESKFGPFALCADGLIYNKDKLTEELIQKGISFSEVSDGTINEIEIIAKLIDQGSSIVEGINNVFEKIEGSVSMLLLNKEGIYAARDKRGCTGLVIGEKNNALAVATETSAFPNLKFKICKYLEPGEIILLTEEGLKSKVQAHTLKQICAFLWVYTSFPASSYEGINVETARENCGKFLAKNDDVEADFVAGVPDSGIAHAIGYSIKSGKPYRRPLIKYTPGYGRSYTPPSQTIRDHIALMKLIPVKEIIENSRIILCEDSIVRGTQLKNFTTQKLWDNGAKEIHVRPACPPLMFPCKFNLSTQSTNELIARRAIRAIEGHDIEDISEYLDSKSEKYKKMIEWIRKDLGITSLKYQLLDDMVKAIGLPKEKLCLYCWTGKENGQKNLTNGKWS